MKETEQLAAAAVALRGFELVPGVAVEAPALGPPCTAAEVSTLRTLVGVVPDAFERLLLEVGPIAAIDAAGGFVSLSYEEVKQQLSLDYGSALTNIDVNGSTKGVFPIGTNSSGSYFLLANDDTGVWKYNVHMRPVAEPQRIASSTSDFLSRLVADWEAMAAGRGSPYMTD